MATDLIAQIELGTVAVQLDISGRTGVSVAKDVVLHREVSGTTTNAGRGSKYCCGDERLSERGWMCLLAGSNDTAVAVASDVVLYMLSKELEVSEILNFCREIINSR